MFEACCCGMTDGSHSGMTDGQPFVLNVTVTEDNDIVLNHDINT